MTVRPCQNTLSCVNGGATMPTTWNCRHSLHFQRGFTLVELLVVIAIIGILVALLLPAIQAAREAARRAQCQSNLHNVAVAAINYHDVNNEFPPGFVPTGPVTAIESWSWSIFTLPYLEEQALYDKLWPSRRFVQPVDGNRRPGGASATGQSSGRNLADLLAGARPDEIALLQTPLSIFRCPSDATPELVPCDGNCPVTNFPIRQQDTEHWERSFLGTNSRPLSPTFYPSTSNYVGSRGMIDAGCSGSGGSPNWRPDEARCDSNGVFYGDSNVSVGQIADGTSKTFMIGERDKFCLAATWIGVRNPLDGAEMHSQYWSLATVFYPLNYPFTGAYNTCTEGFSAPHTGGAFFAFCDGSVRFIDDDINFELANNSPTCTVKTPALLRCRTDFFGKVIGVYQRLAWRDDGLVFDEY
jgi:prepilin-type N-terminal cleavage/methylation domain-containing protein/prepilin-type processing-associated H-X9-DG protein